MTDNGRELLHHRTEFDDWRSLTIGIYMALAGYAVMVGLPVISTAWVNNLGLSAVEVGRVAGADLGGLAIGAVISAIYVARVDRRYLAAGAALDCTLLRTYFVCTSKATKPRFGSVWRQASAAEFTRVSQLQPSLVIPNPRSLLVSSCSPSPVRRAPTLKLLPFLSMNGVYVVLIATYVVGLLFISWLPRRPVDKALDVEIDVEEPSGQHHVEHKHVPAYVPWMVLAAIVLTYINIGAYWTYIELSTVDTAASPEWVASMLWVSSVFSVIGCVFAVLLSNRYGLSRPLLVTLVFQASIVLMLVFGITNATVAFSMFFFNFCWIFVDIYQAATIANVDHSGRFPALIPAAQGLGNFLGPNIAATVLAYGFGYNGVFIMCAMASIAAMLVYLYMYLMLKKTIPALADAS